MKHKCIPKVSKLLIGTTLTILSSQKCSIAHASSDGQKFLEAALQDDAEVQCKLGERHLLLYSKEGDKKDLEKAMKHFHKASSQGISRAQWYLGTIYYNGAGIPRDFKKAALYYQKAADQGIVQAQLCIGSMYQKGEGVKKDYKKAADYYQRAADQGNSDGQFMSGLFYYNGEGVERDLKKATEFFQKAADQGDQQAKEILKKITNTNSNTNNSVTVKTVEPVGDFLTIDTKKSDMAIKNLESTEAKKQAEEMVNNIGDFYPPAIMKLSLYFRNNNDFENAAKYFLIAKIRACIDIEVCKDNSVGDAWRNMIVPYFSNGKDGNPIKKNIAQPLVSSLKSFLKPEKFSDLQKLESETPRNYDQRWVMRYSMQYFIDGMGEESQTKLSIPTLEESKIAAEKIYKIVVQTNYDDLLERCPL